MAVIKMTGKTQVDLDAETAAEAREQEIAEVEAKIRGKEVIAMRLLLVVTEQLWPTFTPEMRSNIRAVFSAQEQDEIREALDKLS